MSWLNDEIKRAGARRDRIPPEARTTVRRPDPEEELRQFLASEYGFNTTEQDEVVQTIISAAIRAASEQKENAQE